ncbi:MAG: CAP domain-containing protein [Myxococcales bacterium]|nr:CAP domain-containing protein [Myxococcales bacterium]
MLARGGSRVDADALLLLARAHGLDAPVVSSLALLDGAAPGEVERWLRALARRWAAPIVCGWARGSSATVWLAAPRAGTLEAIAETGRAWSVWLAPGYGSPRVVVLDGEGQTASLPIVNGRVELPTTTPLPARVQLVASGPMGPRPVAERTVAGRHEGVAADPARLGPVDEGLESDGTLRDWVRRFRSAAGLPALRPNRLLDAAAAAHARDVCDRGAVAHLADGSDPVQRVARQGLTARSVGEIVAMAEHPTGIARRIASSPSHRAALAERRFTDVGVGWYRADGRRSCAVVVLAAWPRPHVR